ncbi:MAG: tetratricopeptide repeat protein, partial [bacterium]|nr:tetratricopeptide repeat protein [bacterium]
METRSSCGMSMAVWAGFVFATLISVACGPRPQGAAEEDHLVSLVNRGVGLMGRYEYGLAIEVFEQAALDEPSNAEVRVNLAIAVLNRQQENDEQYALDLLGEVLVEEPANLRALYCIALLELRRGDAAAAADRLAVVVENSSEDADAAYWLGQSLMALDRIDEAVSWFERAAELDPYLRSASYGTFQARQRLGQRELGMKDLERFQALAENPRARLAEYKYTRMGSKATAAPLQRAISTELPTAPAGPVFADPSFVGVDFEWADEAVSKVPTVCDLNGDAIVDLFLPAVADSASGGANLVLMGQGDGSFGHDPGHPLSSVSEVRTALWGDLDND